MATSCGRCSGALTVEVYERIEAYADLCVQRESRGMTNSVNWDARLHNVVMDLNLLAS